LPSIQNLTHERAGEEKERKRGLRGNYSKREKGRRGGLCQLNKNGTIVKKEDGHARSKEKVCVRSCDQEEGRDLE